MLSGCWLRLLRTVVGQQMGHWPESKDTCRHQKWWPGLCFPTDGWVVFAHQFSSLAGAGPVTLALPGGCFRLGSSIFMDPAWRYLLRRCHRLRRSVCQCKEWRQIHGTADRAVYRKTGKKLFLLFCWLFTLIVIAAFADMVAGTFNAYTVVDGVSTLSDAAVVNGAAEVSPVIHRICRCFWSDPEKNAFYRLERSSSWSGMHHRSFRYRYELPTRYY